MHSFLFQQGKKLAVLKSVVKIHIDLTPNHNFAPHARDGSAQQQPVLLPAV